VDLPEDLAVDGEDVSDIWMGQSRERSKPLHWEWLYSVAGGDEGGYSPPPLAVREGRWKLFVNHQGKGAQLFNIPEDPSEQKDLASEHPALVESLSAKALAWVQTLPSSRVRDALEHSPSRSKKP
jgi:N-acetylgalactosamine-6-sulfatase